MGLSDFFKSDNKYGSVEESGLGKLLASIKSNLVQIIQKYNVDNHSNARSQIVALHSLLVKFEVQVLVKLDHGNDPNILSFRSLKKNAQKIIGDFPTLVSELDESSPIIYLALKKIYDLLPKDKLLPNFQAMVGSFLNPKALAVTQVSEYIGTGHDYKYRLNGVELNIDEQFVIYYKQLIGNIELKLQRVEMCLLSPINEAIYQQEIKQCQEVLNKVKKANNTEAPHIIEEFKGIQQAFESKILSIKDTSLQSFSALNQNNDLVIKTIIENKNDFADILAKKMDESYQRELIKEYSSVISTIQTYLAQISLEPPQEPNNDLPSIVPHVDTMSDAGIFTADWLKGLNEPTFYQTNDVAVEEPTMPTETSIVTLDDLVANKETSNSSNGSFRHSHQPLNKLESVKDIEASDEEDALAIPLLQSPAVESIDDVIANSSTGNAVDSLTRLPENTSLSELDKLYRDSTLIYKNALSKLSKKTTFNLTNVASIQEAIRTLRKQSSGISFADDIKKLSSNIKEIQKLSLAKIEGQIDEINTVIKSQDNKAEQKIIKLNKVAELKSAYDREIIHLQLNNNVDFAAQIAGYKQQIAELESEHSRLIQNYQVSFLSKLNSFDQNINRLKSIANRHLFFIATQDGQITVKQYYEIIKANQQLNQECLVQLEFIRDNSGLFKTVNIDEKSTKLSELNKVNQEKENNLPVRIEELLDLVNLGISQIINNHKALIDDNVVQLPSKQSIKALTHYDENLNQINNLFNENTNLFKHANGASFMEKKLDNYNLISELKETLANSVEKYISDANSKINEVQKAISIFENTTPVKHYQLLKYVNQTFLKSFKYNQVSDEIRKSPLQEYQQEFDKLTQNIQILSEGANQNILTARVKLADALIKELNDYILERGKSFHTEDYFARKKAVNSLREKLNLFKANNVPDDVKLIIRYIDNHYPMFPGKRFQPILNRIKLALEDDRQILLDSKPEALRQLSQNICDNLRSINPELYAKLNSLKTKINGLGDYSITLKENKAFGQAQLVARLTNELEIKLGKFLRENSKKLVNKESLTAETVEQFKKDFHTILHSQDDKMGEHRREYLKIAANILLGVFSAGILLAGRLLYTKCTQGHATLFFDQTKRMEKIEAIDEEFDHLVTAVQAS